MAVGKERCNLNKSLFISCLQNNTEKHPSQAVCVRATVELFSHKIQYFLPIFLTANAFNKAQNIQNTKYHSL
jgi:hypothetical protein